MPGRARGSQQAQGRHRKIPPLHHAEHFDTNGASCAHDCNSVFSRHKESPIMITQTQPVVHAPFSGAACASMSPCQTLDILQDGQILQTSSDLDFKLRLGDRARQLQDTAGAFREFSKIGHDAPWEPVFKAASPPERSRPEGGEEDLMLSPDTMAGGPRRRQRQHQRPLHLHPRHQSEDLARHCRQPWLRPNAERRHRRFFHGNPRRNASGDRRMILIVVSGTGFDRVPPATCL